MWNDGGPGLCLSSAASDRLAAHLRKQILFLQAAGLGAGRGSANAVRSSAEAAQEGWYVPAADGGAEFCQVYLRGHREDL